MLAALRRHMPPALPGFMIRQVGNSPVCENQLNISTTPFEYIAARQRHQLLLPTDGTEDMRRSLAPLLLAGLCLPSVQCFTGLTTAAVRRAGVPVVGQSSNAPATLVSSRRGSARCPKEGRCGTAAAVMMVSKSAALAEETRVDPYEIEADLVEEDKAV